MFDQISMRLPKEITESIKKLSNLWHRDKSTIYREAIEKGLLQIKEETAIILYKEGKISLSKAAQLAGICVIDMMELLVKKGIRSEMTIKDIEEDTRIAEDFV